MTIKQLLESYDEPLNESLFDKKKLEAVGKKIKNGAKFVAKLSAIILALHGAFSSMAGQQIMSWDRDTLGRRIEMAKESLKEAKKEYLFLDGGIEDGKIYPDIYPEVRSKLRNQIMATSDVIDKAEAVLNKEGKLLKAANPYSDKSLKAVKNEIDKVTTSMKITDKVLREADKEIENNAAAHRADLKLKGDPIFRTYKDAQKAKEIFDKNGY